MANDIHVKFCDSNTSSFRDTEVTHKHTNSDDQITSLAEVTNKFRAIHSLLGGGNEQRVTAHGSVGRAEDQRSRGLVLIPDAGHE